MTSDLDTRVIESKRKMIGDARAIDRIAEHCKIESALAAELRASTREERIGGGLYTSIYDKLFRALPDHPLHLKREQEMRADLERQIAVLMQLAPQRCSFLEIGAGDGRVSERMLDHCDRVTALDVSKGVAAGLQEDPRFSFLLSDGVSVPAEEGAIDFAYSNQLLEHLHADDVFDHLVNVRRALKPGGAYFCITPSRFTGPHDVSVYYSEIADGLHLVEYSCKRAARLFSEAGFRKIRFLVAGGEKIYAELTPLAAEIAENFCRAAIKIGGDKLKRMRVIRGLTGIRILAVK